MILINRKFISLCSENIPTLRDKFSARQLGRINFVWIIATMCAALLAGLSEQPGFVIIAGFVGCTVWLSSRAVRLLKQPTKQAKACFFELNIYALMVMILLCLNMIL